MTITHGGKRTGAGRKKGPPAHNFQVWLSPARFEQLKARLECETGKAVVDDKEVIEYARVNCYKALDDLTTA